MLADPSLGRSVSREPHPLHMPGGRLLFVGVLRFRRSSANLGAMQNHPRPEKRYIPLDAPPAPLPLTMHPTLWDLRKRVMGWRVRMAIELVVLLATLAILHQQDAPQWALV